LGLSLGIIACSGLGVFMVYQWYLFQTPFAFVVAHGPYIGHLSPLEKLKNLVKLFPLWGGDYTPLFQSLLLKPTVLNPARSVYFFMNAFILLGNFLLWGFYGGNANGPYLSSAFPWFWLTYGFRERHRDRFLLTACFMSICPCFWRLAGYIKAPSVKPGFFRFWAWKWLPLSCRQPFSFPGTGHSKSGFIRCCKVSWLRFFRGYRHKFKRFADRLEIRCDISGINLTLAHGQLQNGSALFEISLMQINPEGIHAAN